MFRDKSQSPNPQGYSSSSNMTEFDTAFRDLNSKMNTLMNKESSTLTTINLAGINLQNKARLF